LWDLRQGLGFFEGELPDGIDFISADSFFYYLNLAYPVKCREIGALMAILEPFIPTFISEKNLLGLLAAYVAGDYDRLINLEQSLMRRSKLIFIKSAISDNEDNWEHMVSICCKIREKRKSDC
jgi:hypothetical protein